MKSIDLSNVPEAGERKQLTPGGYICMIMNAIDEPGKEYLKIEYDIAVGDFAGYYSNLFDSKGFWGGKFNKSYKEKALSFFKSFITALEESNKGFKWNNDESALRQKYIGLVLGEEEYIKQNGTKGTRLYVDQTRSVDAIKDGKFKVPDKKLLKTAQFTELSNLTDDDMPDWLKN